MTKVNNQPSIDLDTVVRLDVPRPGVLVSDLIEIVNFAYEENVINYWEIEYLSPKKALLTIGSLEHNYTYSFQIKDFSELEEGKIFEINVDTIKRGIESILNGDTKVGNVIIEDIRDNLANGEISGVDSDSVDCIIQAGLFGDIVYG